MMVARRGGTARDIENAAAEAQAREFPKESAAAMVREAGLKAGARMAADGGTLKEVPMANKSIPA